MEPNYVQRLRIKFRKFGATRFISHLDIARTWERSLNRSKIPMAYTQGFNRRPRMQFATATPLGTTSDCEYLDIWLKEHLKPAEAKEKILSRIAPGLDVVEIVDVPTNTEALQNRTVNTTFQVTLRDDVPVETLQARIIATLEADEIIRERTVKKKRKRYDLRPLIQDLKLVPSQNDAGPLVIEMKLTLEPSKTGRPDEVLKTLELDPLSVRTHRIDVEFRPEK
ncbi:MAG: TIGR03936 family radical SAM-associated protein [Chloroflexota bacterium]